jgi:transcriptional regulator with GAF, ATPase, and Fis domain
MNRLSGHNWPGNVRELQNAVERAVILAQTGPLSFDLHESKAVDSSLALTHSPSKSTLLTREELNRQERDNIAGALKQTGGKLFGPDGAAELLGMQPTTLASRIKALGIGRKIGS